MVTLEQTRAAMEELIQPGIRNGKLALWNAALSKRNKLENNTRQAIIMRQYVDKTLPSKTVLKAQLGAIMQSTLDTLYAIEELWNEGLIDFNCGDTYESQASWRERMVRAIPGMGLKTVSFALHIYDPHHCQLLTIDCWHARRMNECYGPISPSNYVLYEQKLFKDIDNLAAMEGYGYDPIVYAACLWERTRKQTSNEYSSHAGLSCYVA